MLARRSLVAFRDGASRRGDDSVGLYNATLVPLLNLLLERRVKEVTRRAAAAAAAAGGPPAAPPELSLLRYRMTWQRVDLGYLDPRCDCAPREPFYSFDLVPRAEETGDFVILPKSDVFHRWARSYWKIDPAEEGVPDFVRGLVKTGQQGYWGSQSLSGAFPRI